MAKRIVFGGYLGCGNLGDDAVMLGVLAALGPGYEPTVLSGEPGATWREHNLDSVARRDRKAVAETFVGAAALVFPGGSIFQDTTSIRSVLYYADQVKAAKKAGCKVALLGQGVGPLKSAFARRWTRESFALADAVTVRDVDSQELLKSFGVKSSLVADSAFLLPPAAPTEDDTAFNVGGMRTVALCPRPVPGYDVATLFAEICRGLFSKGVMPVLLAMDTTVDGPFIREVAAKAGGKIPELSHLASPRDVQARIARMDGVLAMRLHAGILAATVGVPPLMVSYDPKVAAFARRLDIGPALPLAGASATRVVDAFVAFLKDRDRHLPIVARRAAEMAESARGSVDLLRRVLGDA